MYLKFITPILSLIIFTSCLYEDTGIPLTDVTGESGDIILIASDEDWEGEPGRLMLDILQYPVLGLNAEEPTMTVNRISPVVFQGSSIFQPFRNILDMRVNAKYKSPKVSFLTNVRSKTQRYIRIEAPNAEVFRNLVNNYRDSIVNFYVDAEKGRYLDFFKKSQNHSAESHLKEYFNSSMIVPGFINKSKMRDNFTWFSSGVIDGNVNQNLYVFSLPYTSSDQFSEQAIIKACDSISKLHIPSFTPDSYKITELQAPIETNVISSSPYTVEQRGLWASHGALMGGSFVRQIRLNETTQELVFAEVFLYAPGSPKRNLMRQLEAIFDSWTFVSDKE